MGSGILIGVVGTNILLESIMKVQTDIKSGYSIQDVGNITDKLGSQVRNFVGEADKQAQGLSKFVSGSVSAFWTSIKRGLQI
jgi:hypothetical protein